MRPVRLEIKNFLAYCNPESVSFEGVDLACLCGNNGAGKSSLLDAITWALWRRSRAKGSDDELVYMAKEDMSVALEFMQDGVKYRVHRRHSKKKGRTGSLEFQIWDDKAGQWTLHSGNNQSETQSKINGVLRLDYDTFVDSAFLQQGRADSFTLKGPADRKKILANILRLEQWTDYEAEAKERASKIEAELKTLDLSIAEKLKEEENESQVRVALERAEQELERARKDLQSAQDRLAEVAHAPEAKREWERHLNEAKGRVTSCERELQNNTAALEKLNARLAHFQQIIAERESIEAGYRMLEDARRQDFDLGEKVRAVRQLESQIAKVNSDISAQESALREKLQSIAQRIEKSEREIKSAQALEAELAQLESQFAYYDGCRAEEERLREEHLSLSNEASEIKAQNKTLREQMDAIKERMELLKSVDEALCPVCHQPLNEEHRARLTEEYAQEGKTRGNAYRANESRAKDIVNLLAQNADAQKRIAAELKQYEQQRTREGALREKVGRAEKVLHELNDTVSERDLVKAQLNTGDYAHEQRAALKVLEAERDALGYDQSTHDEAREMLRQMSEYEKRWGDLRSALDSLPDVEANLANAQQQRTDIEARHAAEQTAVTNIVAKLESLSVLVREEEIRRKEVNRVRVIERDANNNVSYARQDLNAIEKARERRLELENRRAVLREENAIYDDLRDAFGKNGVPAMIIEAAIPELEVSANRLLSRMTDGRMHIRFDTQRTRKSGEVSETLDILIGDELGTRSYEMFSGGEGFRVNFALRIALSQFLARRAGARLQTLVIDEGFGSQDAMGRERLVEAINAIREDFDMILIVTHIDELRDMFPIHIEVRKTPSGSVVTVKA
jgi:DNA repair protein SbcC/Rad50